MLDIFETPVTVTPNKKKKNFKFFLAILSVYFWGDNVFTFGEITFTFGEVRLTLRDSRSFFGFWEDLFFVAGGFWGLCGSRGGFL